jgi:lysophospholipase L1-like esterase
MKKDFRSTPVQKLVVIGESNAFGMCASDPRNEWVQTVAHLIRDFQDEPLHVLNNSIPANVISPRSPGHATLPDHGKPSALERYETDLIGHQPDLAIIAYGLNDSRCGNPLEPFLEDLEKIVSDTVKRTKSLVVLASPYWNTQYNAELWEGLKEKPEWATGEYSLFAQTGKDLVYSYVIGMKKLAEKYGCLFVDLFTPTEDCLWLMHNDQCHYNDVGQRVLGQLVFNAIACNCSFIGTKSARVGREGNFDIDSTGGTQGMSRMISGWHNR